MNSLKYLFISLVVVLSILVIYGGQKGDNTRPHYPTDIKETSNKQFLVSNKGDKTVVLYPVEFDNPIRTWTFEEIPTGIATRGDFAYITTFETVGKVHFLNLKTGEVEKSLTTGHGACSPLLSPDGRALYVLNQFHNTVV